jgi:hypothetical protein
VNIKFNFYDIYGFALPGFLLLALLWLPFGLIAKNWPDPEFSSAFLGVILAYFAGHVLQTVALNVIPSNFLGGRYPSNVFLDKKDPNYAFSQEFKNRLADQIKTTFQLDVLRNVSDEKADAVRRDAFFLCRSALIKSKTVIYAEQFEGLYALMRGLSAAFALAVAYYLGWAYSSLWPGQWSGPFVLGGIIGALIALIASSRNKTARWVKAGIARWIIAGFLLLAAFASGHYMGQSIVGTSQHRNLLLAAAVFSFFASERCYSGYKYFAQEFAKAVYRDFSNYEKPREQPSTKSSSDTEDEP